MNCKAVQCVAAHSQHDKDIDAIVILIYVRPLNGKYLIVMLDFPPSFMMIKFNNQNQAWKTRVEYNLQALRNSQATIQVHLTSSPRRI